jgi:hypothetical protein
MFREKMRPTTHDGNDKQQTGGAETGGDDDDDDDDGDGRGDGSGRPV